MIKLMFSDEKTEAKLSMLQTSIVGTQQAVKETEA
jgi:hypothetical protein